MNYKEGGTIHDDKAVYLVGSDSLGKRLTRFLGNASKREKISVLWNDDEEKDDWMVGLAKNKRSKTRGTTDDSLPPLDLPRCVIALVPCDDGYDEMMEQINDGDSVCSNE